MKVIIMDEEKISDLLKLSLQVGFYAKAKSLAREGLPVTESLEVERFTNSQKALRFLEAGSERVDLIFVEICLPGMDSCEFIETCRLNYRDKYGEIIAVAGRERQEDIDRGMRAGAKKYLLKPFKPEDLMEYVFNNWSSRENGGLST
ncbi:response regulator [bacterium]|nr:response regulator [bacterium]